MYIQGYEPRPSFLLEDSRSGIHRLSPSLAPYSNLLLNPRFASALSGTWDTTGAPALTTDNPFSPSNCVIIGTGDTIAQTGQFSTGQNILVFFMYRPAAAFGETFYLPTITIGSESYTPTFTEDRWNYGIGWQYEQHKFLNVDSNIITVSSGGDFTYVDNIFAQDMDEVRTGHITPLMRYKGEDAVGVGSQVNSYPKLNLPLATGMGWEAVNSANLLMDINTGDGEHVYDQSVESVSCVGHSLVEGRPGSFALAMHELMPHKRFNNYALGGSTSNQVVQTQLSQAMEWQDLSVYHNTTYNEDYPFTPLTVPAGLAGTPSYTGDVLNIQTVSGLQYGYEVFSGCLVDDEQYQIKGDFRQNGGVDPGPQIYKGLDGAPDLIVQGSVSTGVWEPFDEEFTADAGNDLIIGLYDAVNQTASFRNLKLKRLTVGGKLVPSHNWAENDVIFQCAANDILQWVDAASTTNLYRNLNYIALAIQAESLNAVIVKVAPGILKDDADLSSTTVNTWIDGSSLADVIIDLETAIGDGTSTPGYLQPEYDSGDGVHLTSAGYQLYGETVADGVFLDSNDGRAMDILCVGSTWNPGAKKILLTPGKAYRLVSRGRGDTFSPAAPMIYKGDNVSDAPGDNTELWTGTDSNTWQPVEIPASGNGYLDFEAGTDTYLYLYSNTDLISYSAHFQYLYLYEFDSLGDIPSSFTWPFWGYGETLTMLPGHYPIANQGSPFRGDNDDSVDIAGGAGYGYTATDTYGNIGSGCGGFEAVAEHGYKGVIFSKYIDNDERLELVMENGTFTFYFIDKRAASFLVPEAAIYHVMVLIGDEDVSLFVNRKYSGDFALKPNNQTDRDSESISVTADFGLGARVPDDTEYTIDGVNQTTDVFTISDDGDLSSVFQDYPKLEVRDSTGNDRIYNIQSTNYSSPDFEITVVEEIPNATVDGVILSAIDLYPMQGRLLYFAEWVTTTGWMDYSCQPLIAEERFDALVGIAPQVRPAPNQLEFDRRSATYMEKDSVLYKVGHDFPRVEANGYLPEREFINLLSGDNWLLAEDFDAVTETIIGVINPSTLVDPEGKYKTLEYVHDSSSNYATIGTKYMTTDNATDYLFAAYVEPGPGLPTSTPDIDGLVALYISSDYDLTGQPYALFNCVTGAVVSSLDCTSYIGPLLPDGKRLVAIIAEATAETHIAMVAGGLTAWTGDDETPSLYYWGLKFGKAGLLNSTHYLNTDKSIGETIRDGYFDKQYGDVLSYPSRGVFGSDDLEEGTLQVVATIPGGDPHLISVNDGTVSNSIVLRASGTNTIMDTTLATVSDTVTEPTDIQDGEKHDVRALFKYSGGNVDRSVYANADSTEETGHPEAYITDATTIDIGCDYNGENQPGGPVEVKIMPYSTKKGRE